MSDFVMKTYRDSYLYNQSDGHGNNMMKKHDTALINFIMKAERIDKSSDAFGGIVEDIKRQQTSSILYQVMMMPNVHLCMASIELPAAFKVFEAFDVKSQERRPAVFIDVSKLITLKAGYYTCRDIGKLITYLMGAVTYLLYRKDTAAMVNNSTLTIEGCTCYVSMFNYILDYLRIIGYSQNKDRISYLVALFYMHNMLGKDLDTYTKNLAAKIAKISNQSITAMDLFLDDGIFASIDDFVTFIAETFKLKGFTTEVLISKWIFLYGNGSQYAVELFTSFSILLSNAFCGAYVSNQKQIERCCGQSLVKYCNALLRAAVEGLDRRMYMSEEERAKLEPKTQAVVEAQRAYKLRQKDTSKLQVTMEDFADAKIISQKAEANRLFYEQSRQQEKIIPVAEAMIAVGLNALDQMVQEDTAFAAGTLKSIITEMKPYLAEADTTVLERKMNRTMGLYKESAQNAREVYALDKADRLTAASVELREAVNAL